MKATVNVQSLHELMQVASYGGKTVAMQSGPLVFPMNVFTNVPDPAPSIDHGHIGEELIHIDQAAVSVEVEMSFDEFKQKYLSK